LLEENASRSQDKPPPTNCFLRILVPHNKMGSIIGKAGSKIKDIQESSGARINASEEMLPNSTERAITISGVPDSIHIAVYHIGTILMENFDRNDRSVIFYKPLAKYYQAPPLPAPLSDTYNRSPSHMQSPFLL
jgi:heterogeneous nuclear rnp K-like protein 2